MLKLLHSLSVTSRLAEFLYGIQFAVRPQGESTLAVEPQVQSDRSIGTLGLVQAIFLTLLLGAKLITPSLRIGSPW